MENKTLNRDILSEWSKFNFISFFSFKNEKTYYLFNTLSKALFILTREEYESLLRNKEHYVKNITNYEKNLLKRTKILSRQYSYDYFKHKIHTQSERFDKSKLKIGIIVSSVFFENEEIKKGLLDFINIHKEVKTVEVLWSGYNSIIYYKEIKEFSKRIIQQTDKSYIADIITDADFLLKGEIPLKDLSVSNIHLHFDTEHLLKKTTNISVVKQMIKTLRIINTLECKKVYIYMNSDLISDVLTSFMRRVNTNVVSLIRFNDKDKLCISQMILLNNFSIPSLSSSFSKRQKECIARYVNSFIINEDGFIYKCWKDANNQRRVMGHIADRYYEDLNIYIAYLSLGDPFDNQKCQKCMLVPICGGYCANDLLENIGVQNQYCNSSKKKLKNAINYTLSLNKQNDR